MRNFKITALILATVSFAACDSAYDPDGPAIDPNAPKVHITSPDRGFFAGDVTSIEVRGTAIDDSAITSVTVNGVEAAVDASTGGFSVNIPVAAGTNLLHAIAKDAQGNTGKETRAVVAGRLSSIDRTVPSAITASMSAATFDALGRGAGGFIETANLGTLVQPMNPVLDLGTTNGQPDCLYAQAKITGMDVGKADIKLAPQTGGLYLDATLDNTRVDLHLQWAASCFDGSKDVTISATRLRVRGLLAVGINLGKFDIKLKNQQVTITGFDVDMSGVPGDVIDWLSLDTRMGPVLAFATERFLVPMLNRSLTSLGETKTVEALGKQIDVTVAPHTISFDAVGAVVELDTELRARGDEASPGFVYVANQVPAMDKSRGFQIAVADDAVNQLLGSLWAANGLDASIDLTTGSYGEVGKLYDRVEISAKVPPFIDASGDKLVMTLGDLIATFKNGEQVATQVAINAQLALSVTANPDGSLRVDVGTPTVYVDILDENIDGANALSNAQFELIASFALSRVIAAGSGAAGAIPLPSAGGVAVQDVAINQQTGYLVVDGEVQ